MQVLLHRGWSKLYIPEDREIAMTGCKNSDVKVPKSSVPLPVIEWSKLGDFSAPEPIEIPDGRLPEVDVVIITWTFAEWSALDHVFLTSGTERQPVGDEWCNAWKSLHIDTPAGWANPMRDPALEYQAVKMKRKDREVTVCLIKSEEHLAYEPYIEGLSLEINTILEQCKPAVVISAGTAGAANPHQPLGDVVSTSAAHIRLTDPNNLNAESEKYNNTTITCKDRFTPSELYSQVAEKLMMPLNLVWQGDQIQSTVDTLNEQCETSYTVADLLSPPLQPAELSQGHMQLAGTLPLLTTDEFYISHPEDEKKYCCMEMDDAVVAHLCQQAGVGYGSIRNISDPVVPYVTQAGEEIPGCVRNQWSEDIYGVCGLYTSYNGALGCWAALNTMDLSR